VLNLREIIEAFLNYYNKSDVDIYNEFSLQHELGMYIRNILPNYKIQFERNVSFFTDSTNTIKKEIDISIFNLDMTEKYAIELKFPRNGQFPQQMYYFVKDIKFIEELKERGFNSTACLTIVSSKPFYNGINNHGIYNYFREEFAVYGTIFNPIGKQKDLEQIKLKNRYEFKWKDLNQVEKYYIITI
jgi:hypothetical protein